MLKCPICKIETKKGEPTGKFFTKVKIEYPDGIIGSRIVREVKCCINCSGEEYLEGSEKTEAKITEEKKLEEEAKLSNCQKAVEEMGEIKNE